MTSPILFHNCDFSGNFELGVVLCMVGAGLLALGSTANLCVCF